MNILLIQNADGAVRSVSDCHANVWFRSDRYTTIPCKVDNLLNLHELSSEISGVEIARYTAEDVASWILVNQTAKQAMADAALSEAEKMGLVNNVNRDHASISLVWHTNHWYCYLEFEEGV